MDGHLRFKQFLEQRYDGGRKQSLLPNRRQKRQGF